MQPLLEKENTEFKPVLHAYEIISVTSFSTWTGCILVQNKIKICKGCNPEDLPKAMNDRETWRERVRDIRASRTSWWWWWLYVHISCEKRINDALLINSTLNFLGIPYGVTTIIVENGGCPWCSRYRRRKWTRRHEFKSWTRLIAFHIALIPLGKVWIQLFSLQQWVNSRTD